jgi:hypothetical protein
MTKQGNFTIDRSTTRSQARNRRLYTEIYVEILVTEWQGISWSVARLTFEGVDFSRTRIFREVRDDSFDSFEKEVRAFRATSGHKFGRLQLPADS